MSLIDSQSLAVRRLQATNSVFRKMIDDAPWAASSSIAWKIRKFAVDTTPRKSSAKIGQLMRSAVFGDGSSSLAPCRFAA